MRPEVLIIRCYRVEPGDVDVKDCPVPGDPLDEAKRIASDRLLNHFKSDRFQSGRQPHTAVLVGEDDRIVAKFNVRPAKTGGEEVVEVPNAHRT